MCRPEFREAARFPWQHGDDRKVGPWASGPVALLIGLAALTVMIRVTWAG